MIKLSDILPEQNKAHYRLHLITTLLFLALFVFPLLPLKVANLILMAFSAMTLLCYLLQPKPLGKILLLNLVFVLPFLPYLIEYGISGFDTVAQFEFEKKLFFFTAPLFIPLFIKLTGFKNYKAALLLFSASIVLLSIFSIGCLCFEGIPFNYASYENGAYILRNHFEKITAQHPSYFSLMAMCAAAFIGYSNVRNNNIWRIIKYCCIGLLLLMILFLAAKIAMVSCAAFLIIWLIQRKWTMLKKVVAGFGIISILLVLILCIPSLKQRFNEVGAWASQEPKAGNTIEQRDMIIDCSINVFLDHWLTGTGNRYSQPALNECYQSKGFIIDSQSSFNAHNQYLSMGINYGIVGLLLFLGCLVLIFRKVFKFPVGIYFGIAVLIFLMSESMLERQMGVYTVGLIALLLFNMRAAFDNV